MKTKSIIEIGLFVFFVLVLSFFTFYQTSKSIHVPLSLFDIKHFHNISYNPDEHHFIAVGDDPWFIIGEGNIKIAVLDLTAKLTDFKDVGAFPVYYIPFNSPDANYAEKWKTYPKIEYNGKHIRLHWTFPQEVAQIRIDPFPSSSFTLLGLEVNYRTGIPESARRMMWIICLIYAVIRIFIAYLPLIISFFRTETAFWTCVVILTALKLWLVQGQDLAAYVGAAHDDHLFLRLAQNIVSGSWLGSYNELTLIKGPMYPIWIAGSFLLGIPLLLGQHLFYVGACIFGLFLFRKQIPSFTILILFFALLLFNPGTFDISQARVLRGSIYTSLTLWIIFFLFAIHQYRCEKIRQIVLLSTCLGLFLAAFWLTREEGIWLLPSIALLLSFTIYDLLSGKPHGFRKKACAICLIPVGIWGCAVLAVSALNYSKYGVFSTVEFKTESLKQAYGALVRVSPDRRLPYIPVPRETRKEIYDVSPSFEKLESFLEGDLGKGWASHGAFLTGIDPEEREIAGGWFIWAVRDAAAQAGFHTGGRAAMAFYSGIAREVNAACKDGRLRCGPERSSMAPPLHRENAIILAKRFPGDLLNTASFSSIQVGLMYSLNPSSENRERPFADFEDITREEISPLYNGPIHLPNQAKINRFSISILNSIFLLYKIIMPPLFILSALFFIFSFFFRLFRRKPSFWLVMNAALLGGVAARLLILIYIDITSFPAVYGQYLAPAYPLILLFCFTSLMDMQLPHPSKMEKKFLES